jgi:hypothetical protein
VHVVEVSGALFYDLFEVSPLFEHVVVLLTAGRVILIDELIELPVEKLDAFFGPFVYLAVPLEALHYIYYQSYN